MLYRHMKLRFALVVMLLALTPFVTQAKTEITFIHWYAPDDDLGAAIDEFCTTFSTSNPDITVDSRYVPWSDYQDKVLVQVAGGASPDISLVSGSWFGDFARTGIFLPVDHWLKGTSVSMNDFFQGSADQAKYEGQYYAVPFAGGPQRAMWFKVPALLEAGLNPNDPPNTWDKLYSYAKRLTRDEDGDGVVDRYGVNSDSQLDMWGVSNGADIASPDLSKILWNTPPYIEAMEFMLRLRTEGMARSYGRSDLLSGKIAMYVGGSWLRGYFEARADDVQLTSFPRNSPAGRYYHSADLISVYESTLSSPGKTAAAAKLGAYLASPPVQAAWAMRTGFPPMNIKAIRQPEYLKFVQTNQAQWVATEMMEKIYPYPPLPGASRIKKIMERWVSDVLNSRVPPRAGLENAASEANAVLAELLKK